MEPRDMELIKKLIPNHEELKILMEEHKLLERGLERLHEKPYLTPSEQMEKKRIQKRKLAGKDRIEEILSSYREGDM
jgi:uncharacterized protein YdcH (DUF465 family)